MKVAAHPLMVAVALGLLGPTALADDRRRDDDRSDTHQRDLTDEDVREAVRETDDDPYWARLELVDPDKGL